MQKQQPRRRLDFDDFYPLKPKVRMRERPFEGWPERQSLSLDGADRKPRKRRL